MKFKTRTSGIGLRPQK